jgi:hypothetical protein
LLITAGLFIRSLGEAQRINLGFDPANRLIASIDTFLAGYTDQQSAACGSRPLEQVRSLPGVVDATSTVFAPLTSGYLGDGHLYIEGETPVPDYQRPVVYLVRIGDNYSLRPSAPRMKPN